MNKTNALLLFSLISGCASTVEQDINDLSPKGKTLNQILLSLKNNGYNCNKAQPTNNEKNIFLTLTSMYQKTPV